MNYHKSQHNPHKSPLNLKKLLLNPHKSLLSFLILLLLVILFSCERVIDVDLNEAKPAIVIEGNLSFENGELEVKISKTGSYFSTSPVENVENAIVYLKNTTGTRIDAREVEPGLYKRRNFPAKHDSRYSLHVELDGTEYTAFSYLNPPVKIDSLSYDYQPEARFFDGGYRVLLYFSDPPKVENYYRVRVSKNGKPFNSVSDIIVFDDSRLDGKGIQVRLRGQTFAEGDTANVELLSIDKDAWLYFSTLREMANANPGSPAPANPISNFSNGALGYFSAWSGDEKGIIIE